MRSHVVGALIGATILIGGYAVVSGGGGGGANWSGTFDCYGTTGCSSLPSPASCTTTIAASSLPSYLSSTATGGEVACLNSGTSGSVTLTSKSYSSTVTVQPANNATVTVGTMTLTSVTNLHITGNGGGTATMSNGTINVSGTSTNDTFDYLSVTACASIVDVSTSMNNVLFDHDRFDNLGGCGVDGRLEVNGGGGGDTNTRLTISNSHFGGEGPGGTCSDGIQLQGESTKIGPGNEFTGIDESVCTDGVHTDPIQNNGGPHDGITVTGNYFHDNGTGSGGFESFDSNTAPFLPTTNNVFVCSCVYPHSIAAWGSQNGTFSHNTFAGGGDLSFQNSNGGLGASGNLVQDNAWVSGGIQGNTTTYGTNNHNLNSGLSGTGNVTGTPVFVSSPASGYYHYELDSTSPGYHAGNSGNSMGICSGCG